MGVVSVHEDPYSYILHKPILYRIYWTDIFTYIDPIKNQSHSCKYTIVPWILSGQIIIFHQPRFPWNKGNSLSYLPFGVRSCEVAIIWPDPMGSRKTHKKLIPQNFSPHSSPHSHHSPLDHRRFSLMHNCGAPRRSPQCRTTASGGRCFFGDFSLGLFSSLFICLFFVCVGGGRELDFWMFYQGWISGTAPETSETKKLKPLKTSRLPQKERRTSSNHQFSRASC